jgi:hypothetical protein
LPEELTLKSIPSYVVLNYYSFFDPTTNQTLFYICILVWQIKALNKMLKKDKFHVCYIFIAQTEMLKEETLMTSNVFNRTKLLTAVSYASLTWIPQIQSANLSNICELLPLILLLSVRNERTYSTWPQWKRCISTRHLLFTKKELAATPQENYFLRMSQVCPSYLFTHSAGICSWYWIWS